MKQKLIDRAKLAQSRGKASEWIILHILASEWRTIRYAPED